MESQPDLLSQPMPDPMTAVAALERQSRGLWRQFQTALVVMLIFTLGVNFYLYKQVRMARAQLAQERVSVGRITLEFQRYQEPVFRNFAAKLLAYGYTHRDFLPVIDKYRSYLEPYFPQMPPLQAPAVTPANQPKPVSPAPAAPAKR